MSTHNLANVAAVAEHFQQNNLKLVVKKAAGRKRPPSTNKTERVGQKTAPEPVQQPAEPTIPHTPQSSRVSEVWQHEQARRNIPEPNPLDIVHEHGPVGMPSENATSARVAHVWAMKRASQQQPPASQSAGFRPLPTAQDLLNAPQMSAAAAPAKTKTVHTPVAPVVKEKPVPQPGFSNKQHFRRPGMPTAEELLNGRQQKLAAPVPNKRTVRPTGPSVDLTGFDQPS